MLPLMFNLTRRKKKMYKLLAVGILALGTALITASVTSMNARPAQAGGNQYSNRQVTQVRNFDDGWDVDAGSQQDYASCATNKRKCVEIASNIAYNMAQSGAYADLNDDEFAQLATRIASHIVGITYNHQATSPLAQ